MNILGITRKQKRLPQSTQKSIIYFKFIAIISNTMSKEV